MKICQRGLDFMQIINAKGDVRACSFMHNNYIGNLLEDSLEDIYNGELAQSARNKLLAGDYTDCDNGNCPLMCNHTLEEHMVDVDEVPTYPKELWLAYEGTCNYNCSCCCAHENMEMGKEQNWEENYKIISERLKDVLPHITKISAQGRGELFVSKHILKLLSEWKPLAPADQIKVTLETNGSLFDEQHWKQIENLGQYKLHVAITVMSFDEKAYQYLSGCKYPISKIIDNLKFVKKLREQGIINSLELATVLQERNFREMPEFTRRCIEEFGADIVRIRPIVMMAPGDKNINWFADVRNPKHPYFDEFVDVMSDPIFKNEKVLLWTGDYYSKTGEHPGNKNLRVIKYLDKVFCDTETGNKIEQIMKDNNLDEVVLYGGGRVAKAICRLYSEQLNITQMLDRNFNNYCFNGIEIKHPNTCQGIKSDKALIIVTTVNADYEEIVDYLRERDYKGKIISIKDVVCGIDSIK